jgi:hypothetical protein
VRISLAGKPVSVKMPYCVQDNIRVKTYAASVGRSEVQAQDGLVKYSWWWWLPQASLAIVATSVSFRSLRSTEQSRIIGEVHAGGKRSSRLSEGVE